MSKKLLRWVGIFSILVYSCFSSAGTVQANNLTSQNYIFAESSLDSGGLPKATSTNYQSRDSIGPVAIGSAASANFGVSAGPVTTTNPRLLFTLDAPSSALGYFSTTAATVTTATFSVLNYTSYGYVVQIIGSPPSNGAHSLASLSTTTASIPGMEQFGINLVANTSPSSIGANPVNGQFGFGSPAPGYGTPNEYRYVNGESIAVAPSTGYTAYTISYLINVDNLTPQGDYTTKQTVIVTGTY